MSLPNDNFEFEFIDRLEVESNPKPTDNYLFNKTCELINQLLIGYWEKDIPYLNLQSDQLDLKWLAIPNNLKAVNHSLAKSKYIVKEISVGKYNEYSTVFRIFAL
jgi:hypothetical protein